MEKIIDRLIGVEQTAHRVFTNFQNPGIRIQDNKEAEKRLNLNFLPAVLRKNSVDEYDINEFECRDGEVCFEEDLDADECPEVTMARKLSAMHVRGMTSLKNLNSVRSLCISRPGSILSLLVIL